MRLPSSSIIVRYLAQKHEMPVLSICDNKANAAFSIHTIISTGQRESSKKKRRRRDGSLLRLPGHSTYCHSMSDCFWKTVDGKSIRNMFVSLKDKCLAVFWHELCSVGQI